MKNLHPVAKNNFLPRLFASYGFLLSSWALISSDLFLLPNVIILVAGLLWPFMALWLSALSGRKLQEILNMHVDAVLSSFICLIAPNPWVIFTVVIVLSSNAIFVGFYKLFLSTLVIVLSVVLCGLYIGDIRFISGSQSFELLVMIFLFVYFNLFALMGYKLVRNVLFLNKKVKKLSITDSLTGCFNRMYLDKQLPVDIRKSFRVNYPVTVIFADIDHFKKFNDTYGHKAGDEVIRAFGEILNSSIRKDVDWVSRYGGEEFVIVLTNSTTEGGVIVAERIQKKLSEQQFSFSSDARVTSSFGISCVTKLDDPVDAEILLKHADECLYRAKANGRNRIEIEAR